MTPVFQFICVLNAVFFIIYGFQSLCSQMMIEEFKRFGLSDLQRKVTGTLQILGSIGLLTGFIYTVIGLFAAAGLTAMMFVALIVRIRIKDSVLQALPSILFLLINGWLAFVFYKLF
nr:DoxX family protein [Rhodohalobacter mucosus]